MICRDGRLPEKTERRSKGKVLPKPADAVLVVAVRGDKEVFSAGGPGGLKRVPDEHRTAGLRAAPVPARVEPGHVAGGQKRVLAGLTESLDMAILWQKGARKIRKEQIQIFPVIAALRITKVPVRAEKDPDMLKIVHVFHVVIEVERVFND